MRPRSELPAAAAPSAASAPAAAAKAADASASGGQAALAALAGITVLERGWLSSNNVLIHAAPGEAGAVLVDTGHFVHAEHTVALVQHALAGQALATIVNTHLHSDHCGGNAALQKAFGAPISIPPGQAEAVRAWDLARLTHDDFGRRERFHVADTLSPGEWLHAGGRRWQVLAAPGHDPHSIVLFEPEGGVLLSADALWENGFGLVFPELFGEGGFDEVGHTLRMIEKLPVRVVVPGHGAPFTNVAAALARARSRLEGFRSAPARHARHAAKVLLKYHLMEERSLPEQTLLSWAVAAPLMQRLWNEFSNRETPLPKWVQGFIDELAAANALRIEGGQIHDA